ncbi:hypothetical protein [Nonomuraea sp. NPDC046570]|uniref:hypothetical protein n=1 Tax=Nonomuraea sp. NPDC046570 TaxID=3155255 RepID=UPI0033FA06E3
MLKRSTLAAAVLSLAVLTGCAESAGQAAPSAPADDKNQQRQKLEAVKADCMKRLGFKYIPFVMPPFGALEGAKEVGAGDYEAMKTMRTKYGFGVFAMMVYPKELGSPAVMPDKPIHNPNMEITSKLSKSQLAAYREAADTCDIEAIKKITGKTVRSVMDQYEQADAKATQLAARELDGDARLVSAAAAMADCLKAKGERVTATNPVAMADRGSAVFTAQKKTIALNDDIPDTGLREGQFYEPDLTPEEARPYLDKEIKAALVDLECGREFYASFMPRQTEIRRKVSEEFGTGI